MSVVPPAIQGILPVLAADAGRGRAETLLVIQGVDPQYLRPHLATIDAALGPSSPGIAGLAELLRLAEDAVSTSSPTVERQHVISQVVLRRFVEHVPPGGRQVARFDLASGQSGLIGTNGLGYVNNFVPVDSQTTEGLWQEVERLLNPAVDAALAGTALASPNHLLTIRHAVALHFVRNPQTLTVHNRSFAEAIRQGVDRWDQTQFRGGDFLASVWARARWS